MLEAVVCRGFRDEGLELEELDAALASLSLSSLLTWRSIGPGLCEEALGLAKLLGTSGEVDTLGTSIHST